MQAGELRLLSSTEMIVRIMLETFFDYLDYDDNLFYGYVDCDGRTNNLTEDYDCVNDDVHTTYMIMMTTSMVTTMMMMMKMMMMMMMRKTVTFSSGDDDYDGED